jgi:hypothetical protein
MEGMVVKLPKYPDDMPGFVAGLAEVKDLVFQVTSTITGIESEGNNASCGSLATTCSLGKHLR